MSNRLSYNINAPSNVATNKRSFGLMKRVKDYARNKTGEEKLNNLTAFAAERDIIANIKLDEIL